MDAKIDVFPNFTDEGDKLAGFMLSISSHPEDKLDDFDLTLRGSIPMSDSVAELRCQASARAREILKLLAEAAHF
ncbi:MAG: hypothetical protein ACYC6G_13965 [Desulfobaccales bacterium]